MATQAHWIRRLTDGMDGRSAQAARRASAMMRVGIISDTHGLLRPEAIKHLKGAEHIIHAGDIGAPEVIKGLKHIAPTTVIRGNVDTGGWAREYSDTEFVVLGGRTLYVVHNLKEMMLDPTASGIEVIISGHSHRPKIETQNGVLYLNPGSAGPRRFKLPVALAILELSDRAILPRIIEITS